MRKCSSFEQTTDFLPNLAETGLIPQYFLFNLEPEYRENVVCSKYLKFITKIT